MSKRDERSTAALATMAEELEELTARYEAEIIRLASLSPPVPLGDIAAAARRAPEGIRVRERRAGLPPRRTGFAQGGGHHDGRVSNAA